MSYLNLILAITVIVSVKYFVLHLQLHVDKYFVFI